MYCTVLYLNYTGCPKRSICSSVFKEAVQIIMHIPMTMRIAARFPAFFVVADLDLTVELLFCLLLTKNNIVAFKALEVMMYLQ